VSVCTGGTGGLILSTWMSAGSSYYRRQLPRTAAWLGRRTREDACYGGLNTRGVDCAFYKRAECVQSGRMLGHEHLILTLFYWRVFYVLNAPFSIRRGTVIVCAHVHTCVPIWFVFRSLVPLCVEYRRRRKSG
jgi:hypothetical protein